MSSNQITDEDLILVTGASGYIATHIVKQLLEKGYRVRGTVRSTKDEKKVAPLKRLATNSKFELELCEADLNSEKGWPEAVKGCTYVLHTASPFPSTNPKDENEIITPAVNGTLFVLRACALDGSTVKRVVLTSSFVAVSGDHIKEGYLYSEKDWPSTDNTIPYTKSKILAEKAAWDFVKERESKGLPCFELATINPGYVMGPLLHDSPCTSMEVIKRLMNKEMPLLPKLSMAACDVRDVALAHLKALTNPDAKNNRHIIVTNRDSSSMRDWALILEKEFKSKNYHIPTTESPNIGVKIMSCFDKSLKMITPMLGITPHFDNSRLINILGITPTHLDSTLIDMAYSLIERGFIPKNY